MSPTRSATPTRTRGNGHRVPPQPRTDGPRIEIQPYGTLRRLPLALPDRSRAESCRLLNQVLADTSILYALYKKHHWLVAGPPSTSSISCSTSTPKSSWS